MLLDGEGLSFPQSRSQFLTLSAEYLSLYETPYLNSLHVLLAVSLFFFSIPGGGKLWSTGQIRSAPCFCVADEVRMSFTFLNDWGRKKTSSIFHDR